MTNVLLALKLGLFAPAGYGKMPLPYLSVDAVRPWGFRPGVELGYGLDLVDRGNPWVVNGQTGRRTVYVGAGFAGLTWGIGKSASLGTGVKVRYDQHVSGYVGASVRFKAVGWNHPHDKPVIYKETRTGEWRDRVP